ncbi:PREDICTED: uncharacterized protein LOC108794634 [Nanorana parkeri]|uniref:uncharacterized protein LOC108794634 n=1 Tax=Nanorana parkeri TaxID=125878 RepID=UPI0008543D16|nr:PREDICTED: uncharacterized protein LOC108794634 [Nanorana parkeri]
MTIEKRYLAKSASYWSSVVRKATRLIEDNPDPIKKYREYMEPKITGCKDLFDRQLLVVEESLFSMSELDNISFRDQQKNMNAKELFTIENQQLMSKRMLLDGDVGTGKSYFCKWLEMEWVKKGNTLYQCITYVSGKKINKKDEKTSVKKILEQKCKDLSDVLRMPRVLLILDELDDLVYDANITDTDLPLDKDNNLDIDTLLPLNTLIENIINKHLLPETDVLLVSRRDSPISKLCTSTFVLQEFNGVEAYNVYDTVGRLSADKYKTMKDISYNPAFVLMLCNFNRCAEKVQLTSPHELVIFFLQQYLKELYGEGGHVEEQILQLAKESYENLIKGEQNKIESTSQWKHFLIFFNSSTFKYQCKYLRDMLAALHCVWQSKMGESLKDCLDFWLFGAHIGRKHICPLLSPVAKEHHTKYYNFTRFFMRLLPYPDYNSLCNNTPNLDDNLRKLLRDYFKNILKDHNENFDKLAVVHCVFELHDDYVTKAFSSIEHFSLMNTPLNSLDIRSIVYCFKDVKLQKFDLRLCALTGEYVKQMKNIIKNTGYVLLSSNRLTSETGIFLGELLQEPECLIEKLALGTNDLGPNGAKALWRALEHNRSLRSLYLYDNNIGGEDNNFEMVEHLLKKNSLKELQYVKIFYLDLCLNYFNAKAIETIRTLKAKTTELKVVVGISEDLELFEYVETKVEDLFKTWRNYNKVWLNTLLQIVQADLQNKDWDMDVKLTHERVEKLINEIESIMNIIEKGEST